MLTKFLQRIAGQCNTISDLVGVAVTTVVARTGMSLHCSRTAIVQFVVPRGSCILEVLVIASFTDLDPKFFRDPAFVFVFGSHNLQGIQHYRANAIEPVRTSCWYAIKHRKHTHVSAAIDS